jgi:hypothetical protein
MKLRLQRLSDNKVVHEIDVSEMSLRERAAAVAGMMYSAGRFSGVHIIDADEDPEVRRAQDLDTWNAHRREEHRLLEERRQQAAAEKGGD